jgi:hypothetical protein
MEMAGQQQEDGQHFQVAIFIRIVIPVCHFLKISEFYTYTVKDKVHVSNLIYWSYNPVWSLASSMGSGGFVTAEWVLTQLQEAACLKHPQMCVTKGQPVQA